jgi:hypothetical protein
VRGRQAAPSSPAHARRRGRGRATRASHRELHVSLSPFELRPVVPSSSNRSVDLPWSFDEEVRRREIRLGKRPVDGVSAAASAQGGYILFVSFLF